MMLYLTIKKAKKMLILKVNKVNIVKESIKSIFLSVFSFKKATISSFNMIAKNNK